MTKTAQAIVPLTAMDRLYGGTAAVVFGSLRYAARLLGSPPEELACRAGHLPPGGRPLLWIHGASAGEVAAGVTLAGVLRTHGYTFVAGYTAANRAGVRFARTAAAPGDCAALAPWDSPSWVRHAFDCWRPAALCLVETELWPQLILEAAQRRVPVCCVSARVYPRDVRRYRLVRRWLGSVLQRVSLFLAQDDTERSRLVEIGAPAERCVVTGNLKHVGVTFAAAGDRLPRSALGLDATDIVIVAGSLHSDEVAFLFTALDHLRDARLRVVIAPRHAAAITAIHAAARRRDWRVCQRSAGILVPQWHVLILDSIGELPDVYGLATAAVVGGGFAPHGGHNPCEPVARGVPLFFGRHFVHFDAEARALAAAAPEAQVDTPVQLAAQLAACCTDAARQQRLARRQRQALPDGDAVAQRYLSALAPCLSTALTLAGT